MEAESTPIAEPAKSNTVEPVKGNRTEPVKGNGTVSGRPRSRHVNGILRSLRKPSYTLTKGTDKTRAVNRKRLQRLLSRLERRRNTKDAAGVLSALLKGTVKETSAYPNRAKYSIAMGLFKHLDGYSDISRRTEGLHDIWMKRIGQMKYSPLKERFVVRLESILFNLGQGNFDGAEEAVASLMQEQEFEKDPFSNMIVGWTYCVFWYSKIPKKFRSRVSDEYYSSMESDMSGTKYDESAENSKEHDATSIHENATSFQADSETSVRMDKDIGYDSNIGENRERYMDVDDEPQREVPYVHSAEASDEEHSSMSNRTDNMQNTYTYNGPGFESWLMPVQLSQSNEKELENFLSSNWKKLNDHFKEAIKHLRAALNSSPPVYEALLPLVQMLVLGSYYDEALDVLEKFAHSSRTVLPLRAKADLLEHIDKGNLLKLSVCYEDILKKDPTCSLSLSKLISLHQRGKYNTQQVLELIALHVEASYPEPNIWKEFASCFLKLCRCEEDRLSICVGNSEGEIRQGNSVRYIAVPDFFTLGKSGKSWKLRCRWWLVRHFSRTILSSDIKSGNLQLLAYKAASASHMYGNELEYVVKACEYLQDKDKDFYLLLKMHMRNSLGFCSNIGKIR